MKIIPLLDSAGLEAGFHVSKNSLWSCERSAWIELEYNSLYLVPETNAMIVTSSTNSPSPLPYFNDNISELLRLGSQDLISLFQFYVLSAVACLILSTFPYRPVISSLDFPTSTSRIFKSMFYFFRFHQLLLQAMFCVSASVSRIFKSPFCFYKSRYSSNCCIESGSLPEAPEVAVPSHCTPLQRDPSFEDSSPSLHSTVPQFS